MNNLDAVEHTQQAQSKSFLSVKILSICVGMIALAIVALTVFKVSVGNLFFAGALLLCPLLHVFMMKDGAHKH